MSFAFKNRQDLYASDYIERKRALNNYRYFKKRLDDPKNQNPRPKTISNYDGTAYFMRDDESGTSNSDASYYLANSRSYDHLLSITKGAYLLPTSSRTNKMDSSCVLCPDTSINLAGELYEGNYYSVSSDVTVTPSSSSGLTIGRTSDDSPKTINYPEISQNACNVNLYDAYIKSGNIKFNDASYVGKKYSYPQFKFPSTLRQ